MPDQRIRQSQRKRPGLPGGGGFGKSVDAVQSAGPKGGHVHDQPSESGGEQRDAKGRSRWMPILAVALAVLLGAGAYFGISSGIVDQVSDAEIQAQKTEYQALLTSPGLPLKYVAAEDIDKAIDNMPPNVTAKQREELRNDLNAGRTRLAWVTLWDTQAEDGDVLRFESNATFPIEVTALNAKTTIAIPYPSNGKILVTGVYDGGGGITIALESGAAMINWPTMAPGDTLTLPVTPSL